jgi:hypothetical protein
LNGDLPVLWRLVGAAIELLAKSTPTVIELNDEGSEPTLPDIGWPRVREKDAANIAGAAQEMLADSPVILGPSLWRQASREAAAGIRLPVRALLSEALLTVLRPAGRESVLGVILPENTVTSSSRQALREAMEAHWRPAVMLYAEGALAGVVPNFQIAVLLLTPQYRQWSTIIFKVPTKINPERIEEDFLELLQRRKGIHRGQYGYVVKSPLPPGDSLQFDRHDPALLDRRADLSGYGGTSTLAELYETVAQGVHLPRNAEPCDAADEGAIRILSGRDIRRVGGILLPDDESKWARIPPRFHLKAGDVVLPRIFNASGTEGLVAVEVAPTDLPAAAGHMVIWLRPHPGLSREQRLFTLLYLQRSSLAQTLALSASTSMRGSGMLTPSSLRSLAVPVPDARLTTAIRHVLDAKERLERWHEQADAVLRSMFLNEGVEAQRAHVIESGLKVRSRAEAATLVDDPGYFVRTRFPYPLALRWRRVEAAYASKNWDLAYKEVREAGEVFTCYLALTALALARSGGNPINLGSANQIRDAFKKGTGPGWGQWKAVLRGVGETRRLPATHPLRRMRDLATDEEAIAALQRLYNRRNDVSHLRTVDDDDLPPQVAEAWADLKTLTGRSTFLTDWTLADVVTNSWDSLRNTATVTYRPMMGDHPIVSTRLGHYPGSDLEQGSLYIIDEDERWHLLRPFLIGKRCAVCKTWSTFHADMTFDGMKRKLIIKSLEHGHTEPGEWISTSLEHVGLLISENSENHD